MRYKIYGVGSVVTIEALSPEHAEAEFLMMNPSVSIDRLMTRRCDA